MRTRAFETKRLRSEEVAEFNYRPAACREEYRAWWWYARTFRGRRGEQCLFDEIRHFFYITNDWVKEAGAVVLAPRGANIRCQQENLIQQIQGGVKAFKAPVDSLLSSLGVHGDDQPGLELEGVGSAHAAGDGSGGGEEPGREVVVAGDRVQDIH